MIGWEWKWEMKNELTVSLILFIIFLQEELHTNHTYVILYCIITCDLGHFIQLCGSFACMCAKVAAAVKICGVTIYLTCVKFLQMNKQQNSHRYTYVQYVCLGLVQKIMWCAAAFDAFRARARMCVCVFKFMCLLNIFLQHV